MHLKDSVSVVLLSIYSLMFSTFTRFFPPWTLLLLRKCFDPAIKFENTNMGFPGIASGKKKKKTKKPHLPMQKT